jgi:hypothetical protein
VSSFLVCSSFSLVDLPPLIAVAASVAVRPTVRAAATIRSTRKCYHEAAVPLMEIVQCGIKVRI